MSIRHRYKKLKNN